jgi:hypothetical protein
MVKQEKEEMLTQRPETPGGQIEEVVVLGETGVLGQSQDPQSGSYRALAWGEDGAEEEQLGFGPGPGMKQLTEGLQKVYKMSRQGEHFWPFVVVRPEFTLPAGFRLPLYKVQLRR